ncbi:response regulator transcription factor [Tenacibaculum agarivorans]|uniref:response regulator transcription factor n=1 Tax=Tenacibaculum agarivorans TaxID=1908389 RepID=UPI00094B8FC5|nr:response regulator transcription factor [Tenacibaculum agarivorans]
MSIRKIYTLLFLSISSFVFSKNISPDKFVKATHNSFFYNVKKVNYEFKKDLFDRSIQKNKTNQKDTTLFIKLDSIKQLHQKKLLQKDVLKNTSYYTNFLKDLKNSTISSDQYIFLENELLKISVVNTDKKFRFIRMIAILLFISIVLIILYILKTTKKKVTTVDLTKQEIAIKELIIHGKTNKEIANELHISLNTVKTHISNIYQKLNISNRRDLILNFKN